MEYKCLGFMGSSHLPYFTCRILPRKNYCNCNSFLDILPRIHQSLQTDFCLQNIYQLLPGYTSLYNEAYQWHLRRMCFVCDEALKTQKPQKWRWIAERPLKLDRSIWRQWWDGIMIVTSTNDISCKYSGHFLERNISYPPMSYLSLALEHLCTCS